MKDPKSRLFLLSLALVLAFLPSNARPSLAQNTTGNLTDGCVENYDPAVDYFPDKAEFSYADTVTVDYFNHYKVVEVSQPWVGAENGFTYVLVQCGTPAPEGFDNAQVINVPVESAITMSTTYLPHFARLDLLDHLIGIDNVAYASTEAVIERVESGDIIEVGGGSSVNVELVIDADPDVILTYGSGFPEYDAHPILLDAGLAVVLNADFVENAPLGRAEWLKFTAMFFNEEAAANTLFENIESEYKALLALTADVEERPTVLTNAIFGDAWTVSGAESYAGNFIYDAGGLVAFADREDVATSRGTVMLDIEYIYNEGFDADFWLPNLYNAFSLNDLLGQDERYADFEAVNTGSVYSNIGRIGPNGGFDYYETGLIEPHVILADLISIFHPERLPDHELVYYAALQ